MTYNLYNPLILIIPTLALKPLSPENRINREWLSYLFVVYWQIKVNTYTNCFRAKTQLDIEYLYQATILTTPPPHSNIMGVLYYVHTATWHGVASERALYYQFCYLKELRLQNWIDKLMFISTDKDVICLQLLDNLSSVRPKYVVIIFFNTWIYFNIAVIAVT